jgi:hypothetical protein
VGDILTTKIFFSKQEANIFISNLYGASKKIYETELYKIYETINNCYDKKTKKQVKSDYHITVIYKELGQCFDVCGTLETKQECKQLAWTKIKEVE